MNWVIDAVLWLIQIAGWSGLLLGAALLLAPRPTLRLSNAFGDHDPVAWLDRRHFMERFFYRHHRLFGLAIVSGALYVSYFLATGNPGSELKGEPLSQELLTSALRFLRAANGVLVVFGLLVLIRPSLLKGFEQRANRWFEMGLPRELSTKTHTLGDWLRRSPRIAGLVLCAGGLYLVTFVSVL